jgi:hypothetical protein
MCSRALRTYVRMSSSIEENLPASRLGQAKRRPNTIARTASCWVIADARPNLRLLYKPLVDEWYIWDSLEGSFQPAEKWDD